LRINIHRAVLEGRMERFLTAASAFGSGARPPAKLIEAAPKELPSKPRAPRDVSRGAGKVRRAFDRGSWRAVKCDDTLDRRQQARR